MKISTLQSCMEDLKKQAGDGLLVSSIIGFMDGQTLMSYNSSPRNDAIMAAVTQRADGIVRKAELGKTKNLMFDLPNDMICIILVLNDYCWSLVVDKHRTSLGMLLNVILPSITEEFISAF